MSLTSKARQHQNRRNSSSTVSSPTKQITTIHSSFDSMFHAFQESAMLSAEFVRRSNDCYEQKRRADYDRMVMQSQGQPIPRLPTPSRQSLPDKIRLTMEIQCSDFASLYNGREAWAANDSLSDIMHDTQCMIQFANQCDTERMGIFNQVTITGDMPNIDTAMFRLRQYCPITIVVPLNNIKDEIKQQDPANLVNQWCKGKELGEYSKVQFSILYQPQNALSPANQQIEETKNASPSLVVRASRKDYRLMTAASQAVCRLLFDDEAPTFYSHLKIPVSQRKMISGSPDGVLVRSISTATNTMIHYSKPTEPSIRYYLRGSAGDVINAVRSLQDISPVRIEFEAEDEHLMNPAKDVHRELDLFDIERAVIVQLRKSTYEGDFRYEQEGMRHTLTLMTSEENVQSLYKVRRQLLLEDCWKQEGSPKKKSHPAYMDFLKILVMESSMRAYIGEGKVVSVCRCNDKNHDHHPQIHA